VGLTPTSTSSTNKATSQMSGCCAAIRAFLRSSLKREFIDYKTSMIKDDDPLRGLLFYQDRGSCHTLHVLEERRPEEGPADLPEGPTAVPQPAALPQPMAGRLFLRLKPAQILPDSGATV